MLLPSCFVLFCFNLLAYVSLTRGLCTLILIDWLRVRGEGALSEMGVQKTTKSLDPFLLWGNSWMRGLRRVCNDSDGGKVFVCLFVLNILMCLLCSGSNMLLEYWRFHFWRIQSHWCRISLSLYTSEILGCTFCQKDRLGIWPPCSCDQEYFLWGCFKTVIFLSERPLVRAWSVWNHSVLSGESFQCLGKGNWS